MVLHIIGKKNQLPAEQIKVQSNRLKNAIVAVPSRYQEKENTVTSALDHLTQEVHDKLAAVAAKHPTFQTFMQDMERLADTVWHNARTQAEGDLAQAADQAVTDAKTDLEEGAAPAAPVAAPATPASAPAK